MLYTCAQQQLRIIKLTLAKLSIRRLGSLMLTARISTQTCQTQLLVKSHGGHLVRETEIHSSTAHRRKDMLSV